MTPTSPDDRPRYRSSLARAPDPRVVSIMSRAKLDIAWVGRIKISVAPQTVRSNVAEAERLTEDGQ